jgi:hypothetical protein
MFLQLVAVHKAAARGERHHSHAAAQKLSGDREEAVTNRLNKHEEREKGITSEKVNSTTPPKIHLRLY